MRPPRRNQGGSEATQDEIAVGFGEVGPQGNGLAIGGDGLVELAFVFEGIAEIIVGFGEVGPEGDGLATGGDGLVELSVVSEGTAKSCDRLRRSSGRRAMAWR